jgi:DNA-binding transcriptional MerR regulator
MRISELSRRSGLSVATLKYYLREGLLPPGVSDGPANQADYDETHLHRLHLIRTLIEVGGLRIADVRAVVDAICDPALDRHEMLAVAHSALSGRADDGPADDVARQARTDVDAYLTELDWRSRADTPARAVLAEALAALRRLGRDVDPHVFDGYAQAADTLAAREIDSIDADAPRDQLVESMVIGTVIYETALVALRRLAQANHSARRLG